MFTATQHTDGYFSTMLGEAVHMGTACSQPDPMFTAMPPAGASWTANVPPIAGENWTAGNAGGGVTSSYHPSFPAYRQVPDSVNAPSRQPFFDQTNNQRSPSFQANSFVSIGNKQFNLPPHPDHPQFSNYVGQLGLALFDFKCYPADDLLQTSGVGKKARTYFCTKVREAIIKYNVTGANSCGFNFAANEVLLYCPTLATMHGFAAIQRAIKQSVVNARKKSKTRREKAAGTFKRGLFKRGGERKQEPTAEDVTGAPEDVTGAQAPTANHVTGAPEDVTGAQAPTANVTGVQPRTEDVTGARAQAPTEDVTGADVTGGQKAQALDGEVYLHIGKVQVARGKVIKDPYDVVEVILLEMSETDEAAVFKDEMVSLWSRDNGRFLKECQKGEMVTWLKGDVKSAPTSKRKRKNQTEKVDTLKKTKRDKIQALKKTKKDMVEATKKSRKEHQQSLPRVLRDSYPPKPLKVDQLVAVAYNTGLAVGKVRSIAEDCADVSFMSYSGDGVFSPSTRAQVEKVDPKCVLAIDFPVKDMRGGKVKVQEWEALNAHYVKYKKEYKL
ncbi:Hypp5259 [Branchiostoma lanceolatum]|uniref:Hypp5259 protein n=1 Tax=Branchiostoma lanceolatum TaxID=7740 RepID=A0A8K0AHM7_BRALA|nr:Hypp5259 [Branchiostoma lanceolatum]